MCFHLGHDVLRVQGKVFVLSELHVTVDGAHEQLLQERLILRLGGRLNYIQYEI